MDTLVTPLTDQTLVRCARGERPPAPRVVGLDCCGHGGAYLVRRLLEAGVELPREVINAAEVMEDLQKAMFVVTPWRSGVDHEFEHSTGKVVVGADHKAIEAAHEAIFQARWAVSDRIIRLLDDHGITCSVSGFADSDQYDTTMYDHGKPIVSFGN